MKRAGKYTIQIVSLVFVYCLTVPAMTLNVERVLSHSGNEAWLLQDHTNPIISVDFLFPCGSISDTYAGLANMVSLLLTEGAGNLDNLEFQGYLEDLNISLYFTADHDSISGHLQTLTENLGVASKMLKLAITFPRFDPGSIERIRAQLLAILKQRAENPDLTAKRVWLSHVLPTNHPYSKSIEGTPESLASIKVFDLRAFVDKCFSRNNLIIAVAGDITVEKLVVFLDEVFGDLPDRERPFPISPVSLQSRCTNILVRKNIPQSVVIFGHDSITRSDPDWYAALLVQHILGGGGFDSRLMKEVREYRGLAYSISVTLTSYDAMSIIVGHVATQNNRVHDSVAIIYSEWTKMAEHGPSQVEIDEAKAYLTGAWPLALDGTSQKSKMLLSMQKNNLGLDYLDKRNDYIQRVTLEEAKRVANRLLQPQALVTVIVGQPQGNK